MFIKDKYLKIHIGLDNFGLSVQGVLAKMFRVKKSTKMVSVLLWICSHNPRGNDQQPATPQTQSSLRLDGIDSDVLWELVEVLTKTLSVIYQES